MIDDNNCLKTIKTYQDKIFLILIKKTTSNLSLFLMNKSLCVAFTIPILT